MPPRLVVSRRMSLAAPSKLITAAWSPPARRFSSPVKVLAAFCAAASFSPVIDREVSISSTTSRGRRDAAQRPRLRSGR